MAPTGDRNEALGSASRPSTITRHITGTKEEVIAYLREMHEYQESQTKGEHSTRRYKDKARGYCDGLEYAIGVLEDWDENAPTE